MNFPRRRSQITSPRGADHGAREKPAAGLPVLGQRFFKQNSKWWTKITPVSQVKKVILGKHKLVAIKDKLCMLLATPVKLHENQARSHDSSNNNFIGSYRIYNINIDASLIHFLLRNLTFVVRFA